MPMASACTLAVTLESIEVLIISSVVVVNSPGILSVVTVSNINSGDVDVDLLDNILDAALVSTEEVSSFAVAEVPMLKGLKNVLVILVCDFVVAKVVFR